MQRALQKRKIVKSVMNELYVFPESLASFAHVSSDSEDQEDEEDEELVTEEDGAGDANQHADIKKAEAEKHREFLRATIAEIAKVGSRYGEVKIGAGTPKDLVPTSLIRNLRINDEPVAAETKEKLHKKKRKGKGKGKKNNNNKKKKQLKNRR